jgi:hypothetical protein
MTNVSSRAGLVYPYALHAIAGVLFCAVGVMVAQEIILDFQAAFLLSPNEHGSRFAYLGAAGAVAKVFWLAALGFFIRKRNVGAAIGTLVLGIILHGYSMQATLSLAGEGQDAAISSRSHSMEVRERVEARYEAALTAVRSLSGARPAAEVAAETEALLAQLETAKRREAAETETEAAERKISHCGDRCKAANANKNSAIAEQKRLTLRLAELDTELKSSRKADEARTEMRKAETELNSLKAPDHKDPQAYRLASYLALFGFAVNPQDDAHVEQVSLGKPLFMTLIKEFGAPLTLLMALAFWAQGAQAHANAAPAKRETVTIEHSPIKPTVPLIAGPAPLPALPVSKEQQACDQLAALIREQGGRIPYATKANENGWSGRKLADHLDYPNSSFAGWFKTWVDEKKFAKVQTPDGQVWLALPKAERIALLKRA